MIRPAVAADAAAIAALEAEVFGAEAWSFSQVADELRGFGRRAWVLQEVGAGELVGYVIIRTVGDVSDLQRIAVAPQARGRGRATALLTCAMDAACLDGAERMLLDVAADNHDAWALYRRMAFEEIDRRPRYYRQSIDAVVMERHLPGVPAPVDSAAE